jgi:hypothetical protein
MATGRKGREIITFRSLTVVNQQILRKSNYAKIQGTTSASHIGLFLQSLVIMLRALKNFCWKAALLIGTLLSFL